MKFISIDSSLRSTGVAIGHINDGKITVDRIVLVETAKTKNKQVRASSDTIVRCKQTHDFIHEWINHERPMLVFAETPSGSQSSSAMKSYGATCMLIASIKPAPIEVTPMEVKVASVGTKTASKKEMIDWAHGKYPDVQWDKNKDGSLKNKNEHMADAIAIVHAGIKTDDFERVKQLFGT
jgi:Holliday junction resolvasome RuvABC endonuclease subunit